MKCSKCGAITERRLTTSVTDLEDCFVIVRNVPCHKCSECSEIMYTADVTRHLEKIIDTSERLMLQISVVDYSSAASAQDNKRIDINE
jgi:YgiT-type zinc finger domain-containing protein